MQNATFAEPPAGIDDCIGCSEVLALDPCTQARYSVQAFVCHAQAHDFVDGRGMSADPTLSCLQLRGRGSWGRSDRVTVRRGLLHDPLASAPPHVPVIPFFIRRRFYVPMTNLCSSSWIHRFAWLVSGCVVDGELSMILISGLIKRCGPEEPCLDVTFVGCMASITVLCVVPGVEVRRRGVFRRCWGLSCEIFVNFGHSADGGAFQLPIKAPAFPNPKASIAERESRLPRNPKLESKAIAAVTMDKIQFYQPPNPMSATELQRPKLPALSTLPTPPARRPNPTTDTFTALLCPSQQLRYPLPPRFFPSASPISSPAVQRSQPPETPENDFDRILEEISSDDGSQSLGGNRSNADEHDTIPSRSNLSGFASDHIGMPIEADTAAESATEAGLRTCRSSGSRDGAIVVDGSTEIGHGGEPTSESAGGQTSPPQLPACQAPTDQGDELDGMVDDGGASLTPREVPETPPPLTMCEVGTSARAPYEGVSPHPGGCWPQISVGHAGATREEWLVKRILDSRIRMREGKPLLEYRVAWRPTWQPRGDLIPGCEELVKKFHAEWKDERPSPTTLAGHMRFKQKRRSRRDGGRKIVKSIGNFKAFNAMPNANHGARRSSSTSSDIKGGDKTSQGDEIMEIHSQALEMIEILKRMSAILEAIERGSKERYDANPRASVREDRDAARNI
ncbi:hypothetical protein AJ78_04438 [Emergomyces pasteurianus Ep9510]|uniref:Chromo domain-containing protein n=1 Tax=Emergomyces pasteurianus Ep9510 TaxID=1447872 RepID=A0A1J9PFS3_9EURO|nr:hypothetical protein AJ78_04438 [Emergomyces pasteurianus Ep9510]